VFALVYKTVWNVALYSSVVSVHHSTEQPLTTRPWIALIRVAVAYAGAMGDWATKCGARVASVDLSVTVWS